MTRSLNTLRRFCNAHSKAALALLMGAAMTAGLWCGNIATSHADPGEPNVGPNTAVLDGNTGELIAETGIISNEAWARELATNPTFNPKTGEKMPNKAVANQMRDRLIADLEVRIKGATIEELARIETTGARATMIVQSEIVTRLDGLETDKLAALYKETAAPQIRVAIAKQIAGRPNTKIEVVLDLASATPDTDQFVEVNRQLAEIVAQKASTLEASIVAAFVYTQPFYVRMALVDELMKRNQSGEVTADAMVNAFVGLGTAAANRMDFFEAIMARPDRTVEMTALMLMALDIVESTSSGKG